MKFSITGQENGDLLIEVTTWADLTVYQIHCHKILTNLYPATNYSVRSNK
jgi:hypothetical protein